MAYRIEVSYRENVKDVPAQKLKKKLKTDLNIDIEATHVVDVYTVDTTLDPRTFDIIRSDAFVDPVIQKSINRRRDTGEYAYQQVHI